MENIDKIRLACHKVLSDESLLPRNNETFCNIGAGRILEMLGYNDFKRGNEYLMANEMYDILNSKYEKVDLDYCRLSIVSGNIFVACQKGNPHGHITVIYPVITLSYSSKWRCAVPLVANIGACNGVISLSFAFAQMPNIYLIGEPK
jgi:hypothetical protein